jgi:2'-5' RNA ligase
VYSLNVPVPGEVSKLARGLASECLTATTRDRHTLVVKRLGDDDPSSLGRDVRQALAGLDPFTVEVSGVGVFRNPPTGRGPVAYLRVESPTLERLHAVLCDRFSPVDGIEGDDYIPHVTVARGGDADRVAGSEVSTEWTVDSLVVWAADYGEPVERVSLPA